MKVTLTFKYYKRIGEGKVPLPVSERNGLPTKQITECENDLKLDFAALTAFRGHVTNYGLILPLNLIVEFTTTPEDSSRSV